MINYRTPSIEDGAEIWKMVDETAALDDNSSYAYFMACRNFSATSVVAETDGEIAGMVTAYPMPADPRRLFVWQVNVKDEYQGQGIAKKMLEEILTREECATVRYIETTIGPDNLASQSLFESLAGQFHTEMKQMKVYRSELFPDADDDKEECLFIIGPIERLDNKIEIRLEDGKYHLYAILDGIESPAFEPANPAFSDLDEALEAAEQVRPEYSAKEVVIVNVDAV